MEGMLALYIEVPSSIKQNFLVLNSACPFSSLWNILLAQFELGIKSAFLSPDHQDRALGTPGYIKGRAAHSNLFRPSFSL